MECTNTKPAQIKRDGIYAALLTPFAKDGSVDEEAYRSLIRYELAHGTEGFYCCGSSGEGLLLSEKERMRLVEVLAEEANGKVPYIAHTGSLSTSQVIRMSKHAEAHGVSAVSMIPPIYYHYTPEEMTHYYLDVADAVNLDVIVYNIPQFTGISFNKSNPIMRDERIIGIKHTSMNLYDLERLGQEFPEKILFNGFDEIWLYAQMAGATAAIGTTCNVCPRLYQAIRDELKKSHVAKAQKLQHVANTFVEALRKVGIFSAAKECMTQLGVSLGECRRPFLPLDKDGKKAVSAALEIVKDWL